MPFIITTRLAGKTRTAARDAEGSQGWKTCCKDIAVREHVDEPGKRNVFATQAEAEAAAAEFRVACPGVSTEVVPL